MKISPKIVRKIHQKSTKGWAENRLKGRFMHFLVKSYRRLNPAFNQCGEDFAENCAKNPPKIHQEIPPKLPRVIYKILEGCQRLP